MCPFVPMNMSTIKQDRRAHPQGRLWSERVRGQNSDITCTQKEKREVNLLPPSPSLCCSCAHPNEYEQERAGARACQHWAPRCLLSGRAGAKTQQSNWFYCTDPISFFLLMLSWRPVLVLGAKKRYGRLLSAHASTRRHQWAHKHHNATIKMLSLSSFFMFIF